MLGCAECVTLDYDIVISRFTAIVLGVTHSAPSSARSSAVAAAGAEPDTVHGGGGIWSRGERRATTPSSRKNKKALSASPYLVLSRKIRQKSKKDLTKIESKHILNMRIKTVGETEIIVRRQFAACRERDTRLRLVDVFPLAGSGVQNSGLQMPNPVELSGFGVFLLEVT